jgi:hypothetical protein
MTPQEQRQWLEELFEYENCAECERGEDEHTVCAGPFGPFARCDHPMEDCLTCGRWHNKEDHVDCRAYSMCDDGVARREVNQ